jgi:ATP synthase protein I
MTPETKQYIKSIARDLWYYSSLSFSMAIAIVIGTGLGVFTDNHFGTSPVWTLIGLVLGVCAGFRNIYIAMKRAQRMGKNGSS